MQRFKTKRLFVARATASATTNAVICIRDGTEHFGRFFLVDFLGRKHIVGTNFHAASATDASAVVN